MHASSGQDGVRVFEEQAVIEQRTDCLVRPSPFDGSHVKVKAWPRERSICLEYLDAIREVGGQLLDSDVQPGGLLQAWAQQPA